MKIKIAGMALLASLLLSFTGMAQENTEKHELKANAFNLIIFKTLDISYEYILNPNSGLGISVLSNLQQGEPDWLNDISELPYYNEKFAITPYYRHYFMNRYAKGFFLEAFGMFNSQKVYEDNYFSEDDYEYIGRSTNFAVGISLGGKIVSRRNFVFEFFGGVGRNLITSDPDVATGFVPRVGINLGYRF